MVSGSKVLSGATTFIARPYEGVDSLSDALSLSEIELDGFKSGIGRVALEGEVLPIQDGKVVIYFDSANIQESIRELGIEPGSVRVACVGYGAVIAEKVSLLDAPIDSIESALEVPLVGAPLIFGCMAGFDVRVFLYMAQNNSSDTFAPKRAGTWLSHVEFSVRPLSALTRFSPSPMSEEDRKIFGLPKGCLTYVRVGDDLLEAESLEEEVEVYVDADVLNLLQERLNEPVSAQIQLDLATTTLTAVISKIASIVRSGQSDLTFLEQGGRENAAALLLKAVASASSVSPSSVLKQSEEEPGRMRSCVESYVKLGQRVSATLRDVQ
jgi:hypothetical protein